MTGDTALCFDDETVQEEAPEEASETKRTVNFEDSEGDTHTLPV